MQSISLPNNDLRRHGLPMLCALLAIVAVFAVRPWIGDEFPPMVWLPSILLGAWYGGLVVGLVATSLDALAAAYLLPPMNSFRVEGREAWIHLGMVAFYGLLVSWLCESRRRALASRKRALDDAREARMESQMNQRALAYANANLKHVVNAFIEHDGAAGRRPFADAMVSYSRITGARPQVQPVDAGAVVQRVVARFAPSVRHAGGDITSEREMPTIDADPAQLAQVFENVVDNAVKFRGADPPRIRIFSEPRKDYWVFTVADNGIGIIPARWEEVFGLGVRLEAGRCPGAGMGLPIAKRIVENHGGLMWLTSEAGKGTTVRFTIPNRAG